MAEWQLNNDKTPFTRNYNKTEDFADQAIKIALQAKKNAIKNKADLQNEIEKTIANLRVTVSYIESVKDKLPLNHSVRKKFTPVLLKLDEAESAFKRNNLTSAKKELEKLVITIEEIKKELQIYLIIILKILQMGRLDSEMKQWSKNNGAVSLVVEKFSKKCIVYKSGKKIKEYNVNWV